MAASFPCTTPGCGKVFQRREHLNRHGMSHAFVRPHKCHICQKSFARSDILKRHIQWHTNPPDATRRTGIACQNCRRRKLKCDSNNPCATCVASNVTCERRNGTASCEEDGEQQTAGEASTSSDQSNTFEPPDYASYAWTAPEMDMDLFSGPDLFQWPVVNAVAFSSSSGNDSANSGLGIDTMDMDLESVPWPTPKATGPERQTAQFVAESLYEEPESVAPSISSASSRAVSISAGSRFPSVSAVPPMMKSANGPQTAVGERQMVIPHPLSDQGRSMLVTAAESSIPTEDDAFYSTIKSYWSSKSATIYTSWVHPSWPILDIRQVVSDGGGSLHPLLRAAVLLHARRRVEDTIALPRNFCSLVVEKTLSHLLDFPASKHSDEGVLSAMQTAVLCLAHLLLQEDILSMQTKVATLTQTLISCCRRQSLFALPQVSDTALGSKLWSIREQQKRVAFSAFRIDAYLSVITEQPPMLRYEEMRVTLPASETVWNCPSAEDIPGLLWDEPAGRSRTNFRDLVRNALLTIGCSHRKLRLQEVDYQIGLCALQPLVWELRDNVDDMDPSEESETPQPPSTHPTRAAMAHHLDTFRQDVGKAAQGKNLADGTVAHNMPSALTLTHYHLAQIVSRCSNSFLLSASSVQQSDSTKAADYKHARRLQALGNWANSSGGRANVIHAAQLRRVWSKACPLDEGEGQIPFVPNALLTSAVVICAFSRQTQSCPRCSPVSRFGEEEEDKGPTAMLDLERSDIERETGLPLGQKWVELGGPATCGRLPLCSCHFSEIAALAVSMLPAIPRIQARFHCFLAALDHP